MLEYLFTFGLYLIMLLGVIVLFYAIFSISSVDKNEDKKDEKIISEMEYLLFLLNKKLKRKKNKVFDFSDVTVKS